MRLLTIVWSIMQGVLSFEEHEKRAREKLRVEKGKHIDTEKRLQFWMSRAKDLEARLNMVSTRMQGINLEVMLERAYIVRVDWRLWQG